MSLDDHLFVNTIAGFKLHGFLFFLSRGYVSSGDPGTLKPFNIFTISSCCVYMHLVNLVILAGSCLQLTHTSAILALHIFYIQTRGIIELISEELYQVKSKRRVQRKENTELPNCFLRDKEDNTISSTVGGREF
ncbi:unnamed protein product [Cuscuta europaea]|uniref:Uncharacterized protein n=1 Tax=Cuscuta europaea TaxID=41803 RepID=A0A9P0YIQ1_CUSEU|nr:unnamed protein product [Cuscuta europaea]